MLDLNSPRWAELEHAYGPAGDVPGWLRRLETEWEKASDWSDWYAEPFHSIWSALCHQGSIYTASFAAVPHVADMCGRKPASTRLKALFFIAAVERGRSKGTGPPIPDELTQAYGSTMSKLRELVLPCFEVEWGEMDAAVILLSALAFGMKWGKVGAALLDYQSEAECPQCGVPLPVFGERPRRSTR